MSVWPCHKLSRLWTHLRPEKTSTGSREAMTEGMNGYSVRCAWVKCVCVCVYICRCWITWNRAKRVTQNCIIAPNTTAYLQTSGRDSNWLRWREPTHQAGPRCAESLIKMPAGGSKRHRRTTVMTHAVHHSTQTWKCSVLCSYFCFCFALQGKGREASQSNERVRLHPKTAGPDSSTTCDPERRRRRNRKWIEGYPS